MTGSRTAQPEVSAGRPGIAMWVTLHAIVASGAFGALYEVYDLWLPSHFVGDMYGLEVLMRGVLLAAAGVPFLIASALGLRALSRRRRPSPLGMVDRASPLPMTPQCGMLDLCLSSVYYRLKPIVEEDLALMRRIDEGKGSGTGRTMSSQYL